MKLLIIMGTRPEAIKFAPLIKLLEKETAFELRVCVTGQHREMLQQVLDFFEIEPQYDLNLMKPNQTLFDVSAGALTGLEPILKSYRPDLVLL